jgi:hypothetical protein
MVASATKSSPSTKSATASATALEQAETAREQILGTVRQSKQFALEAATSWVDMVGGTMPSLPAIPGVPTQTDMRRAFAVGFGFVEEVLALQREFAEELLTALPDGPLTPATEPPPSAS